MRRVDPVLEACDQAEGPTHAWQAAVISYVRTGQPDLAEVQALGIVADEVWRHVMEVAEAEPDWGGRNPAAASLASEQSYQDRADEQPGRDPAEPPRPVRPCGIVSR
jgi:hypothetical protein